MKKRSLNIPKPILLSIIIVSLGTVLGVISYTNKYPYNTVSSIFVYCPSSVKDMDDNIYHTIKIGNQCWMKENLKVTKNSNGKNIARYCYDDEEKNCESDGGLYDWNTAMDGAITEGSRGICPSGWHIPTVLDWQSLKRALPTKVIFVPAFTDCVDMKESWNYCSPEEMAKKDKIQYADYSKFDIIFAGWRHNTYSNRNSDVIFWASTKGNNSWSQRIDKTFYTNTELRDVYPKSHGLSIRCLKD